MKGHKIVIGKLGYDSQVKYLSASTNFEVLVPTCFHHIFTVIFDCLLKVSGERPSEIGGILYIVTSSLVLLHINTFSP